MSLAYFPMFPADFDADTGHLSFAEDGAYNRLLRLSWRCPEAKMPDDLDWICRKARAACDDDRNLIGAILAEFFTRKGGKIFSQKLHSIWVEAHASHSKRVRSGKMGGEAKSLKGKDIHPSNAEAMLKQCSSNQNQNHKERKRDTDVSPKPPDGFDEFWAGYPRQIAKPKARSAYAKALTKADAAKILSAMLAYAESRRGADPQFTAHPATWLNGERWNDKIEPIGGMNGKPNRLDAMLRGAGASPVDRGPDRHPSQPLLAVGRSAGNP